jgi:hypothetical protein
MSDLKREELRELCDEVFSLFNSGCYDPSAENIAASWCNRQRPPARIVEFVRDNLQYIFTRVRRTAGKDYPNLHPVSPFYYSMDFDCGKMPENAADAMRCVTFGGGGSGIRMEGIRFTNDVSDVIWRAYQDRRGNNLAGGVKVWLGNIFTHEDSGQISSDYTDRALLEFQKRSMPDAVNGNLLIERVRQDDQEELPFDDNI